MLTPHPRSRRTSASLASQFTLWGLIAGVTLTGAGCQQLGLAKPKLLRPAGTTNEDPWTTQAGSEGRAGRTVEKEYDPLHLRRFLMSEKAMEIERNCGFE